MQCLGHAARCVKTVDRKNANGKTEVQPAPEKGAILTIAVVPASVEIYCYYLKEVERR